MKFRPVLDYDKKRPWEYGEVCWGMDGHIWIFHGGEWHKRETRWWKK